MLVIRKYTVSDKNAWDNYVHNHLQATLYHLSGWKNIIEKTYNHKIYYLMATKEKLGSREAERLGNKNQLKAKSDVASDLPAFKPQNDVVVGILPLIHIKHFLFGNSLISVPFLDYGGILADDRETERALLHEAIKMGRNIGAEIIELRNAGSLQLLDSESFTESNLTFEMPSQKVRMMLRLPISSDELIKSFNSKLRSQIKRPLKDGLYAKIGEKDLIEDFSRVFTANMRDLGSPVHSMKMMENVLNEFPASSNIVIIYKNHIPMACSLVAGHQDTLENPWASSLKEYSRLAPNMLLYWTMLEFACDNGYRYFNFGRSTPGEGTYKFKKQWGAIPEPLHWMNIYLKGEKSINSISENKKFQLASEIWKKLPIPVTRVIGPKIRKYIGL